MNLKFIPAENADIPVIFAQAKELIDTYEDCSAIDYDKVLAWIRKKLEDNIDQYTCVMSEGRRCGYYRLCGDGELDDLYVLPPFRNQGIGTKILESVLQQGKNSVYFYVFSRNIRAISFYERFGFAVVKRVSSTRLIMAQKG